MRITIDGNVGAGKTTLAMALADWLSAEASVVRVFEPVSDWERSGALADYYSGRLSTLDFQKMVLEWHISAWNQAHADYVLADRSEIGHEAMASALLAEDPAALAEYRAFASLACGQLIPADLRLFVNEDPAVCAARAAARGRTAERQLDYSWFQRVGTEQYRIVTDRLATPIRTLEEAQQLIRNQRSCQ